MPVYNGGPFLGEAIESILGQSDADFELIIIDDGSTDRSAEIIRAYAERDSRIVARFRKRRGVVATRNESLSLASGSYLAFMDADDIAEPDRLRLQRSYLEQNPKCAAVGGQILFIDHEGDPLFYSDFPNDHGAIDDRNLDGSGCAISQGTAAIRRDSIIRVGGYNPEYEIAEDLDLFLKLAEVGRLANLDEVVIRYRQHPDSLTHTRLASSRKWTATAIHHARARRGLESSDVETIDPRPRTGTSELMFRAMRAHRSGFPRTARKYVLRSLARAPLSPTAWRVALIVILTHSGTADARPTDQGAKLEKKRWS